MLLIVANLQRFFNTEACGLQTVAEATAGQRIERNRAFIIVSLIVRRVSDGERDGKNSDIDSKSSFILSDCLLGRVAHLASLT